jgi:hydrogenase/urease accessory protein HupE
MRRRVLVAPLAAGLLALPRAVQAHLVTSGLGPFYDGALHLLLSPGDLLGLLALALLAGLRGARAGRLMVIVLPAVWLLGGLIGFGLPPVPDLSWVGATSFLALGLLVATDAKLPPIAVAALAAAYGMLHGLLNGTALAATGAGPSTLLGIVLTALVLALLTAAAVVPLRALWGRVVVRVAGSWVAAVGMLMLGWLLQGRDEAALAAGSGIIRGSNMFGKLRSLCRSRHRRHTLHVRRILRWQEGLMRHSNEDASLIRDRRGTTSVRIPCAMKTATQAAFLHQSGRREVVINAISHLLNGAK